MFISNMYNEVSGHTSNCQWLETVEQLNLMNIKTIKKQDYTEQRKKL